MSERLFEMSGVAFYLGSDLIQGPGRPNGGSPLLPAFNLWAYFLSVMYWPVITPGAFLEWIHCARRPSRGHKGKWCDIFQGYFLPSIVYQTFKCRTPPPRVGGWAGGARLIKGSSRSAPLLVPRATHPQFRRIQTSALFDIFFVPLQPKHMI